MEHRSPRRGPIARAGAARAGRPAPPRRRIGTREGDKVCSAPPARCAAHEQMRWRSDRKNPSDARSSVGRPLRLPIVRPSCIPQAEVTPGIIKINATFVASRKQDAHSCAVQHRPPPRPCIRADSRRELRMRDAPLLHRSCRFDSPVARPAALCTSLAALAPAATFAQTSAPFPVGLKQLDYLADGNRHLALTMFYPAAVRERSAARFVMPFFTNLELYKDAELASDGVKRPLVMFSHGRGSNSLYYAWFAEFLAARGYIVAALDHYRANTYDSTIAYLANKLCQRPCDISLTIR